MTREETVKIIRIMVDSYPNYKPNNLSETVNVWNMMLEEYSYNQVSMALKTYILSDTNGFAPSIGQLVDKIHSITQPQQPNEMEAWAMVCKAMKNSAYNSVEEYAKLPTPIQKAVGSASRLREWALTEDLNKEVVSSNFARAYRIECQREKELAKMPSYVRRMVEIANSNSLKAQIDKKEPQTIKCSTETEKSKFEASEGVTGISKCISDKIQNLRERLRGKNE